MNGTIRRCAAGEPHDGRSSSCSRWPWRRSHSPARRLAYHRADRAEIRAIARGLARHPALDCGDAGAIRLRGADISTADRRFASASCGEDGHFYNILRRPSPASETWTDVLPIGDNPPQCGRVVRLIPHAVIRDLRLGGFRGSREVEYC